MPQNQRSDNNMAIVFIVISILIVISVIVLFAGGGNTDPNAAASSEVVTQSDGKQIIEVTVKGGYFPAVINAKAGIPTILRMNSQSGSGCERSLHIPSLNIVKTLPAVGVTDIELSAQAAGSKLKGVCSMNMYSFVVNFI
jgi:plastocyanin domain-containing protein